jgi:hypothetical protein
MEVDSEIVKDSLSLYMNLVECTDFSTPNDTTPSTDNLWLDPGTLSRFSAQFADF